MPWTPQSTPIFVTHCGLLRRHQYSYVLWTPLSRQILVRRVVWFLRSTSILVRTVDSASESYTVDRAFDSNSQSTLEVRTDTYCASSGPRPVRIVPCSGPNQYVLCPLLGPNRYVLCPLQGPNRYALCPLQGPSWYVLALFMTQTGMYCALFRAQTGMYCALFRAKTGMYCALFWTQTRMYYARFRAQTGTYCALFRAKNRYVLCTPLPAKDQHIMRIYSSQPRPVRSVHSTGPSPNFHAAISSTLPSKTKNKKGRRRIPRLGAWAKTSAYCALLQFKTDMSCPRQGFDYVKQRR